jgi:superfamily II DNA or RNA helicase
MKGAVTLRDYQNNAIRSIKETYERGIQRQLIKVFTGGGKSLIAVGIHKEIMPGKRTLFLVDQIELGEQMVRHFRNNFPDLRVGLEMGNYEENDNCDILVASVQTLGHIKSNRFRKFTKRGFDKYILDECFTGETQILTENGFVRFDQLSKDVKVAQYENGVVEFVTPSRYIDKEYHGEILNISTDRGVSIRCTPNHDLLYYDGTEYKKTKAKDAVFNQGHRYSVGGKHKNGESEPTNWERLMIATQADGNIHKIHIDGTTTIAFSFSKNRKIDRFLQLVQAGGWKMTEVCGKTDGNKTRRRFMIHRLNGVSKNIWDHFELSQINHIKASSIIDEMVEWDGHKPSNGYYFSSTDERAVDFYQSVAILAGYKTLKRVQKDNRKDTYKDVYRLYIKTDLAYVSPQCPKRTTEHFDGRVYCVTVPSGNIIIRHDGKPLVVGNCHKSTAPIWQRVLHAFGVGNKNFEKGKLLVGMTATPNRTDAVGLSINFDDIVCNYDIKYGISNGWLTDIEALYVQTGVSLDAVRKSGDEFNRGDLNDTLNTPERNRLILNSYKELADGEKGIVYCASVDHAYALAELFNKNGINAECIEGMTDKKLRKNWIEDYKTGDLQVLTNFGVLCLDSETEILTNVGWVGMNDMTYRHKVANYVPEDGSVFFKEPKFIIKRKRLPDERMVNSGTSHTHFRVTEHHRMLYRKSKNHGKWVEAKAIDLVDRNNTIIPVCGNVTNPPQQAIDYNDKKVSNDRVYKTRIRANSYNYRKQGMSPEDAKTLAITRIQEREDLSYLKVPELSIRECQFLGFWAGDGSIFSKKGGGDGINFAASLVYPTIINWIDTIIADLKLSVSKSVKEKSVIWNIGKGTGFGSQKINGYYKYIPFLNKRDYNWLYQMNKQQFDAFLFGLWLADGNHGYNPDLEKLPNNFYVYSTFKELVNTVQAMACVNGYKTSYSLEKGRKKNHADLYNISFSTYKTTNFTRPWEIEDNYVDENVWCVTTDTTFIITRNRGSVSITGNTTGFDAPETKFLMIARPIRSTLLFEQIVGRGLRPNAGTQIDLWDGPDERKAAIELSDKDSCKVIDFCDSVSKHQLASVASLFGFAPKAKTKKKRFYNDVVMTLEEAKHDHGLDVSEIEDVDNIEMYVKKRKMKIGTLDRPAEVSRYSDRGWLLVGQNNYEVPYPKDGMSLMVEKNELDKWDLFEYNTKTKNTRKLQTFNDLSGALKIGDEYADKHYKKTPTYNMNGKWAGDAPSTKQIDFVKRLTKGRGITYDKELKYEETGDPLVYYKGELLTKGKMSLLIGRLTGR